MKKGNGRDTNKRKIKAKERKRNGETKKKVKARKHRRKKNETGEEK